MSVLLQGVIYVIPMFIIPVVEIIFISFNITKYNLNCGLMQIYCNRVWWFLWGVRYAIFPITRVY